MAEPLLEARGLDKTYRRGAERVQARQVLFGQRRRLGAWPRLPVQLPLGGHELLERLGHHWTTFVLAQTFVVCVAAGWG